MEGMLRLGADHRPSSCHRTLTIKEGKNDLNWTRLSCRRSKDNQVRLPLFALAYNLANFLRQLALATAGTNLDADDATGEADVAKFHAELVVERAGLRVVGMPSVVAGGLKSCEDFVDWPCQRLYAKF